MNYSPINSSYVNEQDGVGGVLEPITKSLIFRYLDGVLKIRLR